MPKRIPTNPRNQASLVFAVALVVPITLIHYATDTQVVELHNVYRRLYYIPIVLGAFARGPVGGIGVALLAIFGYLPHAFFSDHVDPAPPVDKFLEMILYLVFGALTGRLVEQQNRIRNALQSSLDERDLLEDQLVRAGKLSALGELSEGLAHEIRNPLASILGAVESLTAEFSPGHRKHRIGELLIHEVHRLNGVVTRFGSFARVRPVKLVSHDVFEIAREIVDLTTAQARARGVEITIAAEEAPLDVDEEQIAQVLLNVLLNAYEASSTHEKPTVRIELRPKIAGPKTYTCIVVIDNGPGVSEEHAEQVFDPYFTTRVDGTGLGLSISSRIMEAHDGFLDLVRDGTWTQAWICFPEGS